MNPLFLLTSSLVLTAGSGYGLYSSTLFKNVNARGIINDDDHKAWETRYERNFWDHGSPDHPVWDEFFKLKKGSEESKSEFKRICKGVYNSSFIPWLRDKGFPRWPCFKTYKDIIGEENLIGLFRFIPDSFRERVDYSKRDERFKSNRWREFEEARKNYLENRMDKNKTDAKISELLSTSDEDLSESWKWIKHSMKRIKDPNREAERYEKVVFNIEEEKRNQLLNSCNDILDSWINFDKSMWSFFNLSFHDFNYHYYDEKLEQDTRNFCSRSMEK